MVVTGRQMKEIDRMAIEDYQIPSLRLMESAGAYVFEEVMKELSEETKTVCVICGVGNNGGDGYVVARKLTHHFIPVKVYATGPIEKLAGDCKTNYERLAELGIHISVLDDDEKLQKLREDIKSANVIVDAILGTGITRSVSEYIKEVFEIVNNSGKKVISVDIPSGIGADNGEVFNAAIKAQKTITFQFPKIGCVLFPGAEYTGELLVKDIGIPEEVIRRNHSQIHIIDEDLIKQIIKPKKRDSHKGDYGKLLLIAGSKGMAGAAVLAGKAALRSGVGLLKMAVPESINDILQISLPEAICLPLSGSKSHKLDQTCLDELVAYSKTCSAMAVGPGMGKGKDFFDIMTRLTEEINTPIVIDADAINAIGNDADDFFKRNPYMIITPHPGEMSRLTGLSIQKINDDRIRIARDYSKKWGIIVILKGARSVVASPDGCVYINVTGNPGMATGGSGDVLTGILSSFVAQKIERKEAAIASVYVHGKAGDIMAAKVGEHGLTAMDIAEGVGIAIKSIINK